VDFTEARDSEWQWHQLGHILICILIQTDNHASTPPLSFFTGRTPVKNVMIKNVSYLRHYIQHHAKTVYNFYMIIKSSFSQQKFNTTQNFYLKHEFNKILSALFDCIPMW